MSLGRLLSRTGLTRLGPLSPQLAMDTAALKALDKQLLRSSKGNQLADMVMPAYGKYIGKPAGIAGSTLYGSTMDGAKMLATAGGVFGLARYGGEAARPMYGYLHSIANKINPEAMANYAKSAGPDSVVNIIKPGMAITSKPLMSLDSALGGALHLADNPILASIALPFAAYGAVKGGGALLSRLGRARRLNLLRQGIAPKAYRSQAQRLGFR